MTQLEQRPVLDHGFVRFVGTSLPQADLMRVMSWSFRQHVTERLLNLPEVTIEIRVPYFCLMSILQVNLKCLAYQNMNKNLVYKPTIADIGSGELEFAQKIHDSINQTLDSLMINQEAYKADGCNYNIAALTTPVAAYWEGIITGSLSNWLKFTSVKNLDRPLKDYQNAIRDILTVEYKSYNQYEQWIRQ